MPLGVVPGESVPPWPAEASSAGQVIETRLHYVGEIWIAITNAARFGSLGSGPDVVSEKDRLALRINYSPSFEFPAGTRNEYLYIGGLWFGGIVGTDSLVSMSVNGWGMFEDEITSFDTITEASSSRGSPYYDGGTKGVTSPCSTLVYRNACAEQQYFTRYTDTVIGEHLDEIDNRKHKPLGLEISQTSFAWSGRFARDLVIIQLWVRNISDGPISRFAFGVFLDADIYNAESPGSEAVDDVSGFLASDRNLYCPEAQDQLNVAWTADDNGDPKEGEFPVGSPHGVIGVRILETPPCQGLSFNWWTLYPTYWGPARISSGDPVGGPAGDRASYRLMTNQCIDYGQSFTGIDYSDDGWRAIRHETGCGLAAGADTRVLLSVGPVLQDLNPGDSIRFAFALLAGDDFHRDPAQQFNCLDPEGFLEQKDFSSLSVAAQWAAWIYDLPNFDTDCDGYGGELHYCSPDTIIDTSSWVHSVIIIYGDTIPYTGDLGPQPSSVSYGGAPDLVGPQPPPCPGVASGDLTFETGPGQIILRWSGRNIEVAKDPMTGKRDFEGYRVYVGPRNVPESYSLVASWDIENYKRYFYSPWYDIWQTNDSVYTIGQIRCIVGDPAFEAYKFNTRSPQLCYIDTIINQWGYPTERCSYFEPVGANCGNVIHQEGREWANLIQRVRVDTTVVDSDTVEHGEYEIVLDKLSPALGQYVSITTHDRGDPSIGLDPVETRPGTCNVFAVPIYSADNVAKQDLKVSVYPNPYKITFPGEDGRPTTYYQRGYEAPEKGGETGKFIEQDRRIHFINLPDSATIDIYTLAGDLVRTIQHPDKILSSYSSETSWDLVSRNAQAVVSGIYIYRVTSKLGSQVGKLVIIK